MPPSSGCGKCSSVPPRIWKRARSPPGLDPTIPFEKIRSEEIIIGPEDDPWQIAAEAGEGGTLNCAPSADAVAGNTAPLSWRPSADAVAGNTAQRGERLLV